MRVTHDPRYNIAYIQLQEKLAQVLTLKISDELNIDVGPDGIVYGIDVPLSLTSGQRILPLRAFLL